jgi:hypothetical protein
MRPLILKCPSCNGDLAVSKLHCHACEIALEGDFGVPPLLRLNRAQLDFVEVFLKNRGIIREVERELGVSYPTVRARLDEVLAAIGLNLASTVESQDLQRSGSPQRSGSNDGRGSDDHGDRSEAEDSATRHRRAVLEQLSSGELSPADAMRALGAGAKPKKSSPEEPDHG